ncbi:MAG: Gfo/Idh/MocA family oxidoreductase [Terriglobales bacterium]
MTDLTRRHFLETTAASATAFTILPRHVLGGPGHVAPSDQVTLASIGTGAQGTRVMMDFLRQPNVRVVAVADVNRESSDYSEWAPHEIRKKERAITGDANWGSRWDGPTCGREPARRLVNAYYARHRPAVPGDSSHGCAAYNDFREMLAREHDLDAVAVCTPDHWHAPVAVTAMRAGKHVYGQKAMCHTFYEAKLMADVARQTGAVTQVAVADSASLATRQLCEWIGAGVIGAVRRVENWSTRPYWPQGMDAPTEAQPVPDGLDWDLWLGPAPKRAFNHAYLPFIWRGWYDFGEGALGDMANYSFDTIFRALRLNSPIAVEASSTQPHPQSFPTAALLWFQFPERRDARTPDEVIAGVPFRPAGPGEGVALPPVEIHYYTAQLTPQRPPQLEDGRELGAQGEGLLFIGDQGTIMCGFEGEHPQLIPAARMRAFTPPPATLPPSIGHYQEFLTAVLAAHAGQTPVPPAANFAFEAPIAETIMLGNIATRKRQRLIWDEASRDFTNPSAADCRALLHPPYRAPWDRVMTDQGGAMSGA